MLTYDITNISGPIYKALYELIKADIKSGKLKADEKMPSKRSFANNLGISTISVENAYDQLISEGYIYTLPKKGYFVSNLEGLQRPQILVKESQKITMPEAPKEYAFDFSSNKVASADFPFSIWAKMIRETISEKANELLELSPCGGVRELREAIAKHLQSFRGMSINPDQIIVGAGTEYLYGLLIKLLGKDKIYCIENPGYKKLKQIYEDNDVECRIANMDDKGILVEELKTLNADVAHISPTHHFPTGITMPINRRYEVLAWANEKDDRFIIEDDYDSEFRINGKPIPPLQSIDVCGKVIYMNTFSKSLTSTIRISYMVLPEFLANQFYRRLSFYSCTVSTFEQYALARFINEGYFEKHINRMRLKYGRKRSEIINIIQKSFSREQCKIIENDSGLHFILEFNTQLSDKDFSQRLLKHNIKISPITDYDMSEKSSKEDKHQFIVTYSNMNVERLKEIVVTIPSLQSGFYY